MNEDTHEMRLTPKTPTKIGSWYLLTGLILGFIIGLIYAWWFNPVVYESTHPSSLKDSHKDTYRSMIAQVYAATGNIERAAQRLQLLNDENLVFSLGVQAQLALAEEKVYEAHALALLASALQTGPSPMPESAQPTAPNPTLTVTVQSISTQTLPGPTPTP